MVRSAAYRIAFVSSIAFALATLLLGAAVYYAAHTALERQMDAGIEQASSALESEFREDGIDGIREAMAQRASRTPVSLGYALFDPSGRRIAGGMDLPRPDTGWRRIRFLDPREGPDPARALVTALPDGYRLVVAADLAPLEAIDRTILAIFGVAFVALIGIGLLGTLMLGGYLRRRLLRIERTAAAIAGGDLTPRMELGPSDDEFDRVAASLNAMLDRIESLVVSIRQVTSDLAHDLRTPLARLRNQLELLRERATDSANTELAENAVERADEVLRMFEAILRISELREGNLRHRFEAVDLGTLVEELGEMHAPIAEDEDRSLSWEAQRGCVVRGDRELIAQALINLIENALCHTPPGSHIVLRASCDERMVTACVADNGAGIAPEDRERVLERFVRLESSRTKPGHGLGLSLVKAIADAHGAAVEMRDASPGLEIHLRFPRRQDS